MSETAVLLPSRDEFAAVNNSIFKVTVDNGDGFELCLIAVDEIVSNDCQDNFTLLFRAPLTADAKQGIYHLEHDALGEMELFLVPVKIDDIGLYLEAVFNLIKAARA